MNLPADSPFGPENLPYGVFSPDGGAPRVGVRIGDQVLDLAVALGDEVFAEPALNAFMAQGYDRWVEVRRRIQDLVAGEPPAAALHPVGEVVLHLPFEVADYVDFYASEHHASNVGRLFRPDAEPLLPNWKHLPVGYHGRAGTIYVSGTGVVRPCGQRKGPDGPVFGPSTRLDIEAELGFVVGAGTPANSPISPAEFPRHVFGAVLLNDWSARDIQAWEYVPLGPNLGKSFATSVSPWVVPILALDGARIPLPGQTDPVPLPYLAESRPWGLDIEVTVRWNGQEVARPPFREMYWSPAQMLAHLTVNGASARTGDLYGSGTISGPEPAERGSFLELSWGGRNPLTVNGEPRTFLEDGDEVVFEGTATTASGAKLGFGELRGRVLPARQS
ncbi:fumarylacetoacetate hydrolase [Amycolatopsis sulphurea]|uniref:fumarylacetoacetase n=1 Tax=Amycolatopsis sulphurea TaxID=76022 RepID=A0A2A9FI86_9PSEU|nr:fumarylacetoacetase [Amycolatopsis sulphurea]PFG50466.1 fumarylacetoacetate hydrolase [Amycolatopsis sulphurea]